MVTGEQVEHGKPHPEPYLTAAAALGVPPGDCVAIEDSNTGAKSAEAAGCRSSWWRTTCRSWTGPGGCSGTPSRA